MANRYILDAITRSWADEASHGKKLLDLSCGAGHTAQILARQGFTVTATDYRPPPPMPNEIHRVGGVDLNAFLPFKSAIFDAVNLVEVIEHIENQPQLIREIARVLKPGGLVLISTPNILNMLSRLRFVFTGFLRGRVRPVHYSRPPGRAPNIYLVHFYELSYLFFHVGFEIQELRKTKIKFAPLFFTALLYPLLWLFSLEAIIRAEKDPQQRHYNWQTLRWLFSWPLLLSDNIVIKAKKIPRNENRPHP
jgi:SAM-dependent methyltransferase